MSNGIGDMKQEYIKILKHNHIIKIKDFAKVQTFASFNKSENMYQDILFLKKTILVDNSEIAVVGKNGRSEYVITSDFNTLCYLSFVLNSIWGKVSILPRQNFRDGIGQTNLFLIKNTNIVRNSEIEPYCILIERIIAFLNIYLDKNGVNIDNHSDTIKRFFENMRNFIMMELMMPKLFENNDVSVMYHWINEVNSITDPDNLGESITQIFKSLFMSGNPLMENMNKMRLFITQFTQFMSEYND